MRAEPRITFKEHVFFTDRKKINKGLASNLSLKGISIYSQYIPSTNSIISIKFSNLNSHPAFDLMARIVRTNQTSFAAEFVDIDPVTLSQGWSYIKDHIVKDKECPYCGKSFPDGNIPPECPYCYYKLNFEDHHYLEKREIAYKKKLLLNLINNLPDAQIEKALEGLSRFAVFECRGKKEPADAAQEIIGTSPQMIDVLHTIRKVAATDTPVLIVGASGTGKEMVAKAIHERSFRKDAPFVAINCGAIPENLLESEFFGHEKGSFTGAYKQKKGKVECASGGTLFLDEISEFPLPLQVKLLRFLQDHTIERVGGRQSIEVDLRVIAASNVNLKEAIKLGRFREDLYYRIDVVRIELPPLREKGDDVVTMAQVFLRRYAEAAGRKINGFTMQAITALKAYSWPGNVRELINRIRRAVVMTETKWITPEDLDLRIKGLPLFQENMGLREARGQFESDFIQKVLKTHGDNITRTAKELKISRSELYYLIQKYEITRPASR